MHWQMLRLCLDPGECSAAAAAMKQVSNCDRLPVKGKTTAVAKCCATSPTRYVPAEMATVFTQDFY